MTTNAIVAWTAFVVTAFAADRVRAQDGEADRDGTWTTVGYGLAVTIDGDRARVQQWTRLGALDVGGGRFVDGDLDAPAVLDLRVGGERFRVDWRATGDGRAELLIPELAAPIAIVRHDEPPAALARRPESSRRACVEWFATTFDELYPFFERRGVDWPAAVARAAGDAWPDDADDELLWARLVGLVRPLGDQHVFVTDGGRRWFSTGRALEPAWSANGVRRVFATCERDHLEEPLRDLWGQELRYGALDASTAYLRLRSFEGPGDDFAGRRAALDAALATVVEDLAARDALVLDLRIQWGGSDRLALLVASALRGDGGVVFSKAARDDPRDATSLAEPHDVVLTPREGAFDRDLVILTSRFTVSAGEVLTLALRGRPRTLHAGETTQGVFADVQRRLLPNGWLFGLTTEVYRDPAGVCPEVDGLVPDLALPVPSDEPVRDDWLDAVVERLPLAR